MAEMIAQCATCEPSEQSTSTSTWISDKRMLLAAHEAKSLSTPATHEHLTRWLPSFPDRIGQKHTLYSMILSCDDETWRACVADGTHEYGGAA